MFISMLKIKLFVILSKPDFCFGYTTKDFLKLCPGAHILSKIGTFISKKKKIEKVEKLKSFFEFDKDKLFSNLRS